MGKSIKTRLIFNILYTLMITLIINAEVKINSEFCRANKGSNIIINCESNEPIEWFDMWKKFPYFKYEIYDWKVLNSEVYMQVANPMIENYNLTSDNDTSYRYKITLNLINVNYKFVGFYFCKTTAFNISQPTDLFRHDKEAKANIGRVHVEVTDKDHPMAEIPTTLHVFETDYCYTRMSCKSTNHREYKATFKPKEKDKDCKDFDDCIVGVPPMHLNRVPKQLTPNRRNVFECSVGQEKEPIILHVHNMMDKDKDECKDLNNCAKILSKFGEIGIEGSELDMTCIYDTSYYVRVRNVTWIYPEKSLAKQENRTREDLWTSCLERQNQKLIITNLKKSDIGIYKCIVYKEDGNRFSSEINITSIYDGNKPHLIASVDQKIIKSHSNEEEESIVVRYVADRNSNFSLEYNNISYGEFPEIVKAEDESSFVKNMSKKIQVLNYERLLVVMIRNLTIGDMGNYTLHACNKSGSASVTFELLVEGDPIFTFGNVVYENGNTTVDFNIIGYLPAFNVSLKFKHINGIIIEPKYSIEMKNKTNISRTIVFSFEEISDLATVVCSVHDIENNKDYHSDEQPIQKRNSMYHLLWIVPIPFLLLFYIARFILEHINEYFPVKLEKWETIAKGNFGEVVRAYVRKPFRKSQTVAIKRLHTKGIITDMAMFRMEINLVQRLPNHQNIVSFIGAVIWKGELMLISEFCNGCDLKTFLTDDREGIFADQIEDDGNASNATDQRPRIYTKTHMIYWSAQIACGLNFLVLKQILHRDVTARNMILCEDGFIKICDFGLARVFSNEKSKIWYWEKFDQRRMAYEALENGVFTEKSDVWSFGLLMWEIFTKGEDPFPSLNTDDINYGTILSALGEMEDPPYATTEINDVINRCLNKRPELRPTFDDLEKNIRRIMNNEPVSFINGTILNDATDQLSNPNDDIEMSTIVNISGERPRYRTRPSNVQGIQRAQTGLTMPKTFGWINKLINPNGQQAQSATADNNPAEKSKYTKLPSNIKSV